MTKYSKFIMKREQKKKFLAFSPLDRTPRNMWKYCISCVIRTLKSKKNRNIDYFALSEKEVESNKKHFKKVLKKLKKEKNVDEHDKIRFDRIVYISKIQELYEWTYQVLASIDQKTKEANKKGWFRLLSFSNNKQSTKEALFKEVVSTQDEEEILPLSYVWLVFNFSLGSGGFYLSKNKSGSHDQTETIVIAYEDLRVNSQSRIAGIDISLSIRTFDVLYNDYVSKIVLITKLAENSHDLMRICYSSKPPDSTATARLTLEAQSIDVSLDTTALNSLLSFFLVLNVQENVKTAAWDKFQEFQDTTQETLTDLFYKQNRFEITIKASGPRIKLPSQNGCFYLSLGSIFMSNQEIIQDDRYEEFSISMESLQLEYEKFSNKISIVPSFVIKFSLRYLKSKIKENKWAVKDPVLEALPDLVIIGEIPRIVAKTSPSIYHQLLTIIKTTHLDFDFSSRIHLDKKEIIKNSKLISKIRKQGSGIQNWSQYIAILSGTYIYFFANEKEAIPAAEFYIKDCALTHILDIPCTFQLQNRFGVCVISFPKEKDFQKWEDTLLDQILKLRTSKSAAKDNSQKDYEKKTVYAKMNIPTISLKLCNEDGIAISEIKVGQILATLDARPYDLLLNTSLGSLIIRDLQRHSSSTHFNTFAKSVDDSSGLINLNLQYFENNSPLYKNQDLAMEVKLGKVEVNWNPDIISTILSFFTFAEYSDPDYKKAQPVGMIYPNHILINFHIQLESIDVFLNNVQKEISLAVISVNHTDTNFIVFNGGYEFKGCMGNLVLSDLTNYPKTALMEPTRKFTLFSVKEESESLLRFNIFIYTNDNPEKPKDVGNRVELELNSVSIIYVHQPFMRILDYVSYKIIGVFDAQARVRDINYWSPIYKLSYLLNLPTIQSLKNDEDLMQDSKSFTTLKICMKNPMITLAPRPGYYESLIVDLGDITICNSPGYEKQNDEEIWLDIYTIHMQNVNVVSQQSTITEHFNMYLTVIRPVLSHKQEADQSVDKKYRIEGICETIKLRFSHEDYRLVLKLMDLNLTYDDQLENYINPESIPYVHVDDPGHGGVFFDLKMEFEVLSVLLEHEYEPLSEFLGIKTTFKMVKYNDLASEIKFCCQHFIGLISEQIIRKKDAESELQWVEGGKGVEEEHKGEISEGIFDIPESSELQKYMQHIRLKKVLFGPLIEETPKDISPGFLLDMKTEWDGSKSLIIKFEQMRVNFHWTVFQMIQNFFFYGFPDYTIEEETPYDYMHKYKPSEKFVKKEILSQYFAPRLLVNLCLKNPIMLLPTCGSDRVVIAQTGVNFMYLREPEHDNYNDEDRTGEMKYVLHQLELYTCKLEEVLSKSSFMSVRKRRIAEPVQIFYECLYLRPGKLNFVYKTRYEIEKLIFTVSHRDILLLNSVAQVQNSFLTNKSSIIASLAKYPKESNAESLVIDNYTESIYSFSGINILVINDAMGAYSPILDINFQNMRINIVDNKKLWSLQTSLSPRINYYNPEIDVWEPFVELSTINIDINNSPLANPQNQRIVILDENMPLNLNLTEAMIMHLQIVLETWGQTTLRQANELVSPISICNKTGYYIKVCRVTTNRDSKPKEELEVPINKTLNFEIDSTEIRSLDFSKETLSIMIPDFPTLNGILMNKLTSFIREIGEDIYAIVEVHFVGTTKVLTVRSEFAVINQTDYTFYLKFSVNDEDYSETQCKPGMESQVPFKYTKKNISLKPLQYIDKSWIEFDLEEFRSKKSGDCTEVRIDDFYFLLVMVRDQSIPKKITLIIKAPIIISNYLPCLMTLQIYYENLNIREINLQPQESYKEYTTSVNSNMQCSLKLPHFNLSDRMHVLHRKKRPPKYITVRDSYESLPLNVYIYYKVDSSHLINFYAPVVFINNTSVPITFYYKKTSTRKVAGQVIDNPITPAHSTKKAKISMGRFKSKSVKIGAVGVKNVIQFLGDPDKDNFQTRYQFLYEILLARVIEGELLFTKVMIISPRYLILNNMPEEDLVLQQYNSSSPEILIARNSKEPFHWPDVEAEELLVCKFGCGNWAYSGAFAISNIGTFTVQCKKTTSICDFKIIKLEIKLQESTTYVIFTEETEKHSSYRIDNMSQRFTIIVFQDGCREEFRKISSQSTSAFAWSQPLLDHELIMYFYNCPYAEALIDNKPEFKFKFAFDEINTIYKLPTVDDEDYIYGRTFHEGSSKVLEITDSPISREKKREAIISQTHMTIHKVGISIIEQCVGSTCEVLYLSASNITILNQATKIQKRTEVFIKSFQIDNQYNFSAIYPVLLYPADPLNDVVHFTALSFVHDDPNCMHYEKVSMKVQPLTLNLESWIVRKILEMITRIAKQNSPVYDAMQVYKCHKSPTWTRKDQIINDLRYYIANMEIQPMKLILSFVPLKEESTGSDSFNKVARALGMAITAIDSVPVKLYSAEMTDVFGTRGQIFSVIWMHYRAQLASEIFTLIGHAEILGNPVGLLNNLGTGVVDFFYEPAHGMIKGPIGAGKGLIRGTGSLLKNTIQGTFGTVSKLANSLATGITLAQDREYLSGRQREKMNKPKNVVDGVGMGFKVFFSNLGKGIAGVVTEPYKGYKKKKIKGLLVGGVRGVSGLFIKPMAGILDAASKAAEGIKNTTEVFNKTVTFQRSRVPRAFYGEKSSVKPYNEYDAQVIFFMNQLKKGIFIKEHFVAQAVGKDLRGEKLVCVLYMVKFILADIRTKKILWIVDIESICSCNIIDKGIVLSTFPSKYKITKGRESFLIPFPDERIRNLLFMKIRDILKPMEINLN